MDRIGGPPGQSSYSPMIVPVGGANQILHSGSKETCVAGNGVTGVYPPPGVRSVSREAS